jgi:hypothetical protein
MPVIAIAKEDNVFSSAEFSIGEKKGVQKGVPDHKCLFGGGGLGMMCVRFYLFHWYHVLCTCKRTTTLSFSFTCLFNHLSNVYLVHPLVPTIDTLLIYTQSDSK